MGKPEPQVKPELVLIEDNADTRDLLQVFLESKFDVLVFSNPMDALRRLREQTPAVILSDVLMPDMDGLQFVRQLRASGISTPVIALSANVVRGASEKALEAGFNVFIAKPITDLAGLVSTIEKLINAPEA